MLTHQNREAWKHANNFLVNQILKTPTTARNHTQCACLAKCINKELKEGEPHRAIIDHIESTENGLGQIPKKFSLALVNFNGVYRVVRVVISWKNFCWHQSRKFPLWTGLKGGCWAELVTFNKTSSMTTESILYVHDCHGHPVLMSQVSTLKGAIEEQQHFRIVTHNEWLIAESAEREWRGRYLRLENEELLATYHRSSHAEWSEFSPLAEGFVICQSKFGVS